jgi:D-3-phosphoglycerate dehydrogenase
MARVCLGPLTRALVVEEPSPVLDELLRAGGMDVVRYEGSPDEDRLRALLAEHRSQVLFKRSQVEVSEDVIAASEHLLAVQLCCIGDDSVDKDAAAAHGVMVFNDPVSNGRSVVELALAHLIALSRRLYETEPACRGGRWDKSSSERYEIRGKTLGVLGLGNIGRQIARAAEDLGMHVRFYDSRHAPCEVGLEFGWELATSVRDLLRSSDCVTVHLSATDVHGRSNRGVLDGGLLHELGADRPDDSPRIFLNLSRGFLHSAESLLEAVERGAIRRAAVDVYPNEPGLDQAWTNPYAREPRIAVTPHIGASTLEAQPRIARRVAHTILQFAQYGTLRDCVFDPRARLQLLEEGARGGQTLLAVAHATTRGTKRAVDEAIYDAGASNLSSVHRDFEAFGIAYELAEIDRPLDEREVRALVEKARAVTGDDQAMRSVRLLRAPSS